ncbi:MAG: helix-turn-helix transcriptional regulator, partial [Pararhodobacter sp.]
DILHSSDQEMIWSQTCSFFADLGFKHVLYGYSPDSHGAVLGSPENYLVLSTLKQDVIRQIVREGYFRMSGTFHWALSNAGIASWSLTPQQVGMPDDFEITPEVAAFFFQHGLINGCTIGFPQERTRGRAVMALIAPPTTSQEEVDVQLDAARDLIFTVAATAHRCLSSLPYHPPGRRLTQRQREVLEWVAEGKTTADIAQIMGITPPTVEKHLRLARETLGVETTPHALIKASFLNQVFVAAPADDGSLKPLPVWPI